MAERKNHWETVYLNKSPEQVSWTQEEPTVSLEMIKGLKLEKSAKIIDVGGGDSNLVDFLLEEGYENITVLDISTKALEKAQQRLGIEKASKVKWIASDIVEFKPEEHYDLWHDRAAFHFLTTEEQINAYIKIAEEFADRYLVVGTFSDNGPKKCSGLEITQYSEEEMANVFGEDFEKMYCIEHEHVTPFNTKQNFVFCSFMKK
ncbi:class I SAM-dependent methyltransferase [Aureibacter tunicatorum]|uniref:Methyltransferase domain-containing protein n=1 Tax=Aureibacter tunicatorum TaxID=866807 RepID=A0AAE3XTF9_9BACT|nr:class I SAM-dependent methyltransferase [Aureibacter tunicatorum]MDR6241339.1 hypothetical protein [Aureibacter tunicatorum]BDD03598.1 hypothetical protein AUTU_10810 [Aureibacter tunicatorum]